MAGDPPHACVRRRAGRDVCLCLEEEDEVCHTETFRHVP